MVLAPKGVWEFSEISCRLVVSLRGGKGKTITHNQPKTTKLRWLHEHGVAASGSRTYEGREPPGNSPLGLRAPAQHGSLATDYGQQRRNGCSAGKETGGGNVDTSQALTRWQSIRHSAFQARAGPLQA